MRKFLLCIVLLVCVCGMALSVHGATLSPGLAVLAAQNDMAVSAKAGEQIHFEATDFKSAVGSSFSHLTVTELPPASHGSLLLEDVPLEKGQAIPFSALSGLVFVPEHDEIAETSFSFRTSEHYDLTCRMCFLTEANAAPEITAAEENRTVWTQCDLSADGVLSGYDPDGDSLRFEIVKRPENGLLELTNPTLGTYVYTPYAAVIGTDSFSYRIRDVYGEYSETVTVSVTVSEPLTDISITDLSDGTAYNAAAIMLSAGYMDCEVKGGSVYFNPDGTMSRENFLVTVMDVLGAGNLPTVTVTAFADDADISDSARPYVYAAYHLGIVNGVSRDHQLFFNPKEAITQTEAAAIISRILGTAESTVPVFASETAVPAWAQNAAFTMCRLGIMSENHFLLGDPALTRSEAASMFLKLLELTGQI